MYFEGRKVLIKALFGSHNYNLNTKNSDKDYKVFLMPNFIDLYDKKTFHLSTVGQVEDIAAYDIRRLPAMLYKSSANFIEILYSIETYISNEPGYELLNKIFELKDEIAKMNLKSLFGTSKGMYFSEMKELEKATEETKALVEAHKYDTKKAVHALRIIDFIERFYNTNYSDFKRCMTYDATDREYFLSVKNGLYSIDEFRKIAEARFEKMMRLEQEYCKHDNNEELNNYITDLVKQIVFTNRNDCLKIG